MSHPRVTLEQWRALQAVVDNGGFAQAATALHRSQSSVSYTLAKLQEQLGIPVLRIEGRKAILTDEGEVLLRRARHLLQEAIELEQFAAGLGLGWETEVHLVVDAAFPTDLLLRALSRFAPRSHGSRVQLNEVVLSGAEEALAQGSADLVIGASMPAGFLGDPLLDIEFIAVSHASHPLQQLQRQITTSDLERELQIVIRDSGVRQQRDVGWLGAEHRWSVSSMETAITAVVDGLGYCWLPEHSICKQLEAGVLKALPLREGGRYKATLYLVYGQPGEPGPGTQLLAELLRDEARARP
ncbi:LysR family transcriptional regulator [Sulfuriflexus sp.]|uniref:LysR family transcriptional regulator n=1 Tax=Sulfuriflexus sp. TaxID=2015443 RepID=UPI0028CD8A8E|nr:LysR family transcriptional regulator [Sulfuriflexus sp.]MDT8405260.1 LysR family transcriptional regulator [Sulfuriflexus sp.]